MNGASMGTPMPKTGTHRTSRATGLLLAFALVAAVLSTGATASAAPATASCDTRNNNTYEKLLECVTVAGAMRHLEAFQAIADAHGDTRAAGTSGYDASAAYVADQLRAAGYVVELQAFEFPFFQELTPPVLRQLAPTAVDYVAGQDVVTMTYSGAGDVTAAVTAVDIPPTGLGSGCEAADFAGFTAGTIAVIQRGGCNFSVKALNAQSAGAAGVVIFNQPAGAPAFAGTLGEPGLRIPVVGTSWDVGQQLIGATSVQLKTDTIAEIRTTHNVLAETPGGRADNVVMVGAHLDSVIAGPGINDNGSGSAALIEVAQKLRKVDVENKVRFAWWGAEELGLIGSDYYVANLTDEERDDIALYLNFDMIASPNYVRFVYDGDGSAFGLAGPEGSAQIEALYEDFYASRGLAWEPTQISFRSDYAAFFDFGIPFGGLFTGAEGIKTVEEAAIYGGTVGEWYDPCYHQACDDIDNLSLEVFDLNLDAVAFSTLTYAYSTEDVNGEPGRRVPGKASSVFGSRVNAPAGAGQHTHSGGGGLHPERDPDHDDDHDHDHDHLYNRPAE
ncbi:M28 family metallopeptidase [Egicoccus sp. AB-alg2]|uniref:M28 family metallopeptidase n=1 Tax=Egicoccus sp. AB-alg2 TaxID=3242693 RepID=UPI00359DE314